MSAQAKSARKRRFSLERDAPWLMPALPWLVCAAVLAIWELCCYAFAVPEFILPRPSRITGVLITSAGPIWFHTQHTLITTMIGFALSVAVGLLVGIAVGSSKLI
jgi:NitT/TauT family transport system permease protein